MTEERADTERADAVVAATSVLARRNREAVAGFAQGDVWTVAAEIVDAVLAVVDRSE